MAVNTDISCVLPRPDIGELHQMVTTELSKRLLGGAPVLPLSSEDILAFIMAGTVNLMHGTVTQALKEQDPATMCCDNLVIYAARRGVDLMGATRAKGYVAITGDPDALIPQTFRVVGPSSREYKLDLGVSFNPVHLTATGGAVLRVVSVRPGSIYNVSPGAELIVATTAPGIDGTATVVGNGLTGGTDAEDCDSLRRRVLAAETQDVLVVNEAWYLRETMRYPGVTRACTDACQGCCDPTYIAIYPFMEGVYGEWNEGPRPDIDPPEIGYGVPPCEVLEEMTLWMFGREIGRGQGLAPVGIRGAFQQAWPSVMDVSAQCFKGCPVGAEDRIKEALWQYVRYNLCVGSTICKDQLRAAAYKALGPDPCMSNMQFHFNEGVRYEDDAYVYLDCGRFAVMGDINLRAGY